LECSGSCVVPVGPITTNNTATITFQR
jgi:hypothetical protein